MICKTCNATDGFKFCTSVNSDGRQVYRNYCPNCKGFIGSMVKKEIALNCGYELTQQDGNTGEYEYHRLMNKINDFMGSFINSHGDFQLVEYHHGYNLYFNDIRCPYFIPYETAEGWRYGFYDDEYTFKNSGFSDLYESAITEEEFNNKWLNPKFAHKIPKILLDEYNDYIHSEKWKRKRELRMALDNHECKICFSKTELRVHHITYAELNNEPMNHLLTVCRTCHSLIHGHDTQ